MNIVSIALKNNIELLRSYVELGISERITMDDMKLLIESVNEDIVLVVARAIIPDVRIYYLIYRMYNICMFNVRQWKEILDHVDENTIIELIDNISGYYGYENVFQCIRRGYIGLSKLIMCKLRYPFSWRNKNDATLDEILSLGVYINIVVDELDYSDIITVLDTSIQHSLIGHNKHVLSRERLIHLYNTYPTYRRGILNSFAYNIEDIECIIHVDFPINIMHFYNTNRELVMRNIQYTTPHQIFIHCDNNASYPNELVQLLIGSTLDDEYININTLPEVLAPCFKNARVVCNLCYSTYEYNVLYKKMKAMHIKSIRYGSTTLFHTIFLYEFTQSNLSPCLTVANDYDVLTYYIGVLCPNGLKRLYQLHNDMPEVIHTYYRLFPQYITVIHDKFKNYCDMPKKRGQPYINNYEAFKDIDIR